MAYVGGSGLAEKFQILRDALQEYFGVLSSMRDGLPVKSIPEKPQALIMYDQCKAMGIPLLPGGLMDQPHIWLLEYAICQQERELNTIRERAKNDTQSSPQSSPVAATAKADVLRNVGRV
jgi:hypothetical protein